MRVNPNPMPDLLAALNQSRLDAQEAMLQISTGQSVNQPSDNPAAAALLIENHDQTTFADGYLQNLDSVQGQLSTADSTLSSVVTALQRAVSLGIEGANGTLSDSDRASIANEVEAIQSQLVSLANSSYEGHYVFAGTRTNTAPYVVDGNAPSGVDYVGNTGVNEVSVGNGYKIAVNVPGSRLFSASGHDVFLALNGLIQALQNNTGIGDAVGALNAASSYLSAERVFYGNAMNQAQSQTTYLNTAKLQLSQQQNNLGGADLAAAATHLASAQGATSATLAAMGRFSQMSLFDYLK